MDRTIEYAGQIPLVEQVLQRQRFAYVALGKFINMVMGETATIADGFDYTPSTTALTALIASGSFTANGVTTVDPNGYGALAPGITFAARQYILQTAITVTLTAGATNSIYVTGSSPQTGNVVLPYYNAANPSQTFAGPGNSGAAQPTAMQDVATVSVTTGAVPAGGILLYTITLPAGAANAAAATSQTFGSAFITKMPQLAPLLSPHFVGVPTAPTAALGGTSTQLATLAFAAGARSLGVNGYKIHPDGVIEQWGTYITGANGAVTTQFPIAFSSACFNVVVCEGNATATWTGSPSTPTVHGIASAPTPTAFGVYSLRWNANNSQWQPAANTGFYRAIGY